MGQRRILAHHLILSGYGFWLANDPRGSGSDELREGKFEELGAIHRGRKRVQPDREKLRQFYQLADPRLDHEPLWFDERLRRRIGELFGAVVERRGYCVWACSIGANHAHLCVRVHRDSFQTMWGNLTAQVRTSFTVAGLAAREHPVWADRPYSKYLHTGEDIRRVIAYIEGNPGKEGLAGQTWGFVKRYDGWPGRAG